MDAVSGGSGALGHWQSLTLVVNANYFVIMDIDVLMTIRGWGLLVMVVLVVLVMLVVHDLATRRRGCY